MKNSGPHVIAIALDWLGKHCSHSSDDSLAASSICDGFEKQARRVPRNICADPVVEAKRAVSGSIKLGLSAFKKSITNCLNEADEVYVREFATALGSHSKEYLGLEISFVEGRDEKNQRLQISMMSANDPSRIRIRAVKQLGQANSTRVEISVIPGDPGAVRTATDEDFSKLLSSN